MALPNVSKPQLERYPLYLTYLKNLDSNSYVSSSKLAKDLDLNEEQVRKDLQVVSKRKGKPRMGREVRLLIKDLEVFLGYHDHTNAIVVGVGHLGQAFLNFEGFKHFGLNVVSGFDIDDKLVGYSVNDKPIYHIDRLNDLVGKLEATIAILTTPRSSAQEMADKLVRAGIKGIWNFVPTHLNVNDDVVVENVDLASSLAVLSYKLDIKFKEVK